MDDREHTAAVVTLSDERARRPALTGGKTANLARLLSASFRVPEGLCVTTEVYHKLIDDEVICSLIGELEGIGPDGPAKSRELTAAIRERIEAGSLPANVRGAVTELIDEEAVYAVRSSATAEDLPSASFAGQHDTVLNVSGVDAVEEAVLRCMASLFTERAVSYRAVNQIPHSDVAMAVVVQRMIDAESSGVLFTADPTSGRRSIASIDAAFGLGEAVVSGTVTAESIQVDRRSGEILDRRPQGNADSDTDSNAGGPVLDVAQIAELVEVGGRIEDLFDSPQDVEWSFTDENLWILQSRPITTLWPIPSPPPESDGLHVYYSWNHRQGMTEVMPPLVADCWLRTMRGILDRMGFRPAIGPVPVTGGGLVYIDMTAFLVSDRIRPKMLDGLDEFDRQAIAPLKEVMEQRGDELPDSSLLRGISPGQSLVSGLRLGVVFLRSVDSILRGMVGSYHEEVPSRGRRWADELAGNLIQRIRAGATVRDRIELVLEANDEAAWKAMSQALMLWNIYYYRSRINRLCGDAEEEIEALQRGLRQNVTTAMMLELGDLTDIARDLPAVEEAIIEGADLDEIQETEGGKEFVAAFERFLERYGFRAPAEIEFSRPRYHEDPSPLLSSIQTSLKSGSRGEHLRHMERLEDKADEAIETLMYRAGKGIFGSIRRRRVRANAVRFRSYLAMRELTKYALSQLLSETRRQVLEAGEHLAREGGLEAVDDVWYFTLDELLDALHEPSRPPAIDINQRRSDLRRYRQQRPARVITSDGEIPLGDTGDPSDGDGLVGIPTSGGVAEGVVRVILDPTEAALEPGEILVAPHTDPGWTPLFLNAVGLVTNVGGLMTHGSLVAREYGIPSVVLADATEKLQSGQTIRVDGDRGVIELLHAEHEDAESL